MAGPTRGVCAILVDQDVEEVMPANHTDAAGLGVLSGRNVECRVCQPAKKPGRINGQRRIDPSLKRRQVAKDCAVW